MLRRHLGAELRRLRERADRTAAEVARELRWSESKLSRIETAASGVRNADLERLLTVYSVGGQDRARLAALAAQARQRAWWEGYGDALLDPYETYIGFEAEASSIFTYDALTLNGLLQTVEYANYVIHAVSAGEGADVVGQRVAVRMARQAVLMREPPPRLWSMIDEAVLRRPVGSKDVMRRQLMRLLEVRDQAKITIRVLPFSAGVHQGIDGSFTILEFPDEADRPLVYCDGMTGGVFRNKPEEFRRYWMSFEALRSAALGEEDSAAFISAAMREYE
jgi:transcriptional regulator with XRE-family HTH domain